MNRNAQNLNACKVIRNVMRAHGYRWIWTNAYLNTKEPSRSVKCWTTVDSMRSGNMVAEVIQTMEAMGYVLDRDFEVRFWYAVPHSDSAIFNVKV